MILSKTATNKTFDEKLEFEQITEIAQTPAFRSSAACDCYHDYEPLEHWLSLATVNVLGGEAKPLQNSSNAERCFINSSWIAAIRGESPDGYVPPSTRYLCSWCKDHWAKAGNPANSFELLK